MYGSICRATGEPFVFPGSPQQYGGVTDITDARLLGRHAVWSATEPAARNQAFNTVNGDVFRWRQMWVRVAEGLGVEAARVPRMRRSRWRAGWATPTRCGPAWSSEHGLAPHTRVRAGLVVAHRRGPGPRGRDVRRHVARAARLGFLDFQDSARSFLDLFDTLREQKVIPPLP